MLTNTNDIPSAIEESQSSSSSAYGHTTHLVDDMLDGKHSFIRILKRAPQRAILGHSSVKAFISHCGLTSIHETMFAGKPALCIPGFGDQPMNAYRLEHHGAGERVFWWEISTEAIIEKLTRIMQGDTATSARLATERLDKMIRLASRRTPMAADMVELAAIPSAIQMLEPAEYRLLW
jgi:UDP:flavonoid glycosyltransferase YjiC (YdhE family)